MKYLVANSGRVFLLLTIVIFLSRIPAVLSSNLYMDGDEAIVGIMTLHFAKGIHLPGFFYGQSYGLSFFETLFALPGQLVFPGSIHAFKLSILMLFSCGVWFFWMYARRQFGNFNALACTIVLILLPGWFLWSMKGRGGYVTSFVFFNVLLYITSLPRSTSKRSLRKSLLVGVIVSIIQLAQPLWLIGAIPFLFEYFRKMKWQNGLMSLIGFLVSSIFWRFFTHTVNGNFWTSPPMQIQLNFENLNVLMETFKQSFSGAYYLNDKLPVFGAASWIGYAGWGIVLIVILGLLMRLVKSFEWFYFLFLGAIVISIMQVMLNGFMGPRYYIPVLQLLLMGLLMFRFNKMVWTWGGSVLCFFLIAADVALTEMRPNLDVPSKTSFVKEINQLKDALLDREVIGAYSTNPLLQWQLMFVSNEAVKARWIFPVDRYPKYGEKVDQAFFGGQKIAIIGFGEDYLTEILESRGRTLNYTDGPMFYYYLNPNFKELRSANFMFNEVSEVINPDTNR